MPCRIRFNNCCNRGSPTARTPDGRRFWYALIVPRQLLPRPHFPQRRQPLQNVHLALHQFLFERHPPPTHGRPTPHTLPMPWPHSFLEEPLFRCALAGAHPRCQHFFSFHGTAHRSTPQQGLPVPHPLQRTNRTRCHTSLPSIPLSGKLSTIPSFFMFLLYSFEYVRGRAYTQTRKHSIPWILRIQLSQQLKQSQRILIISIHHASIQLTTFVPLHVCHTTLIQSIKSQIDTSALEHLPLTITSLHTDNLTTPPTRSNRSAPGDSFLITRSTYTSDDDGFVPDSASANIHLIAHDAQHLFPFPTLAPLIMRFAGPATLSIRPLINNSTTLHPLLDHHLSARRQRNPLHQHDPIDQLPTILSTINPHFKRRWLRTMAHRPTPHVTAAHTRRTCSRSNFNSANNDNQPRNSCPPDHT